MLLTITVVRVPHLPGLAVIAAKSVPLCVRHDRLQTPGITDPLYIVVGYEFCVRIRQHVDLSDTLFAHVVRGRDGARGKCCFVLCKLVHHGTGIH